MVPKCFQTLDNGQRCSAPAIMGSRFCRHHHLERSPRPAQPESAPTKPLKLPLIVDNPSALTAVNLVLQALSEDRIKRSVAQTLLSGIKFAARLIAEMAGQGLTALTSSPSHLRPAQSSARFQPARTDGKLALALAAAAADHCKPNPFSSARHSSEFQSEVDPDTARIVKDLVAQSRNIATNQKLQARS